MEVRSGFGPYLAVISHTYFDTFNNAVQAFTPYEPYCAGQYEMWKNINYFNYRILWYQEKAPSVRERVLKESFWNVNFDTKEMVKGMIHRLAYYTEPKVNESTIKEIETKLQLDEVDLKEEIIDFYEHLEDSLTKELINQTNTENIKVKL